MIIIGIDPGIDRAGYGVIEKQGATLLLREAGILKVGKLRGADALFEIKKELELLIAKYKPEILATEKLFFMKNQTSGIQIAEARGVILLAAREHNLEIREYAPTEVKMSVAGYGQADKIAVAKMVRLILKAPDLSVIDDASDALAIAIAAARYKYENMPLGH
jgi:crossover junction endodeoxyribonuclease RuvC